MEPLGELRLKGLDWVDHYFEKISGPNFDLIDREIDEFYKRHDIESKWRKLVKIRESMEDILGEITDTRQELFEGRTGKDEFRICVSSQINKYRKRLRKSKITVSVRSAVPLIPGVLSALIGLAPELVLHLTTFLGATSINMILHEERAIEKIKQLFQWSFLRSSVKVNTSF